MRTKSSEPSSGVLGAVLLPHAPILIPAVAGARAPECANSTAAMRAAARRLLDTGPEVVVLVSPHAERTARAFGISSRRVVGSLARFGAAEVEVDLPPQPELAALLGETAGKRGLHTVALDEPGADHGTVVPLWFLVEAGWRGPTLVVALTWEANDFVAELGECVAEAAVRLGLGVGVVASGDMSHRLKPGAPCGFDPEAKKYDDAFIAGLRAGQTRELTGRVARWRDGAAEDVLDSTLFACGAAGWRADGREVLGYEGPFGVGYGVAVLYEQARRRADVLPMEALPSLARASIASQLGFSPLMTEPRPGLLPGRNGVFVTLHNPDGSLRGCVGTTECRCGDLAVETWQMARAAASRDPRFAPVRPEELEGLRIEVTILEKPEPIASEAELDPRRWGVVVRTADGRRGLLLPDLPTVRSVREQIGIARAKGRIGPEEPVMLERFVARCLAEEARP